MKAILVLGFILLASVSVHCQRDRSALLKGKEGERLAKQCSRDSPRDFTEQWEPTAEVIKKMESRLSNISKLNAKCCIEGASIEDPSKWFMQYAALVWRGKRIIYISAIEREQPTNYVIENGKFKEIPSDSWKDFAVVICDGGNTWGVIYDPETGRFSELSINGIA